MTISCPDMALSNCTNITTSEAPPMSGVDSGIVLAFQVTGICVLIIIMVSMGCTINFQDLVPHLKRPWGVLIGFTSQYLCMPLIGFSLAHAFGLKPSYAIGVLIISCCPGGTMSNIYTYWTDGDVALSILMTSASTLLALGMMPLTLFIYSRSWTTQSAVIPYGSIAQSLAAIVVPVFIGIFIRYKWIKVAEIILKVCNVLTMLAILSLIIMAPFINPEIFDAPWSLYFMGVCMPIIGGLLGYLMGTIFNMPRYQRRTISFETGLQNVPVATTLVSLSFPLNDLSNYLIYPIIYGVTMLIDGGMAVIIYKVWKWKNGGSGETENKETGEKKEVDNKKETVDLQLKTTV